MRKYIKQMNINAFVPTPNLVKYFNEVWNLKSVTLRDINIIGVFDVHSNPKDEDGTHVIIL